MGEGRSSMGSVKRRGGNACNPGTRQLGSVLQAGQALFRASQMGRAADRPWVREWLTRTPAPVGPPPHPRQATLAGPHPVPGSRQAHGDPRPEGAAAGFIPT